MRRFSIASIAIAMLLLAACGTSSTSAAGNAPTASPTASTPTIKMDSGDFIGNTALIIKAGQSVTFDFPMPAAFSSSLTTAAALSPGGGSGHILVTGTHGAFQAIAGAPSEFATASGLFVHIGQKQTVTFPHAGTFPITCTIHPMMQATITVMP